MRRVKLFQLYIKYLALVAMLCAASTASGAGLDLDQLLGMTPATSAGEHVERKSTGELGLPVYEAESIYLTMHLQRLVKAEHV